MKQFNHSFQQKQKSKLSFKFPQLLLYIVFSGLLFPEVGEEQTLFFILNPAYTQAIIPST